jgi:hypothetical protein
MALASIGILAGGAFGQSSQRPMDEANPGQTNQGKMNGGSTAQTTPDVTVGKTADATFAKKAAAGGMAGASVDKNGSPTQ